jgi:hypothetical protein
MEYCEAEKDRQGSGQSYPAYFPNNYQSECHENVSTASVVYSRFR